MTNQKSKMVQNYFLEELKQVWPDGSQIWSVTHQILKKRFTLKSIKYNSRKSFNCSQSQQTSSNSTDAYSKLMILNNSLKRLNIRSAPRCQKMLKTSSHLYIVYDQFPPLTLAQYLTKETLTLLQKWKLMQRLVETVKEVHSKNMVLLTLCPDNIYLGKQGFIFGDWDLSRVVSREQSIESSLMFLENNLMGEEVREQGVDGFQSDIYSLGKILLMIQSSGFKQNNLILKTKFDHIIRLMLSKQVQQRPSLNQLCSFFTPQKQDKIDKTTQFQHSPPKILSQTIKLKQPINLKETSEITVKQSHNRILHCASSFQLDISSPSLRIQSEKSILEGSPYLKKEKRLTLQTKTNNLRYSKNSDKSRNAFDNYYIHACCQRNLAFLLLDLSQFVVRMQICPQLAFLLITKSSNLLKSAIQDFLNKANRVYEDQKLILIMKEQFANLSKSLRLLQQVNFSQKAGEQQLMEKVVQFGKQIVIQCQKKGSSLGKMSEILFKTYLILKKVEEGSYESFWRKVSQPDYVLLSHQKYLREQKGLGYRYLKSKIGQILTKKQ